MSATHAEGWNRILAGYSWFAGAGNFPLPAYSEFMPPPRIGKNLYTGEEDHFHRDPEDPFGFIINETEEETELCPGLAHIGQQIMHSLVKMGRGQPSPLIHGHEGQNMTDNPYWPEEIREYAGKLDHERFLSFLPLALSKSQDDKGRVRWTFYGASEQGPEKAFWRSFMQEPDKAKTAEEFVRFISQVLELAYHVKTGTAHSLLEAGFRILPSRPDPKFPHWCVDPLPEAAHPFIIKDDHPADKIKYLLTFNPFSSLPSSVKKRYLGGKLNLLPFPGSMAFFGMANHHTLLDRVPLGMQITMVPLVKRHDGKGLIRVPQSAWLKEPREGEKEEEILEELVLNTYTRSSRWDRSHRYEELPPEKIRINRVAQMLFSTQPEVMDLYDKPMARNSQLITKEGKLLLDGPSAGRDEILAAADKVLEGGLFRYRMYFPPMRAGSYSIFYHRPVVACLAEGNNDVTCLPSALSGYLTAYPSHSPDLADPVELFPRFLRREVYLHALKDFDHFWEHQPHSISGSIIRLLVIPELLKHSIHASFARQLIRMPEKKTLSEWIEHLDHHSSDPASVEMIRKEIRKGIDFSEAGIPEPLTFGLTATREFEVNYWNTIFNLSTGQYPNSDNADVVHDEITLKSTSHHSRDLHRLGDHLIRYYTEEIRKAGLEDSADAGDLPFTWKTDFDYTVYGGWKANQDGKETERNILVRIPGKNRNEAVIMSDHYDTAYMEDIYYKDIGGTGARLSAHGADDNHSATATLMLAAPIFLEMSKKGLLERDIWLLHLTGEEFPSDCMGARHLTMSLIEKTLTLHLPDDTTKDLSHVRVKGIFLMDMIAHNNDSAPDIFQISPGRSRESLELSTIAHQANMAWNQVAEVNNQLPERKSCTRGKRSGSEGPMPETALHLPLDGEVRTWLDPQSSLFNTDGQVFSDAGIPVILFMENYDIHRTGYHDTHDTMENIDLDYGSALAAIVIETMARAGV